MTWGVVRHIFHSPHRRLVSSAQRLLPKISGDNMKSKARSIGAGIISAAMLGLYGCGGGSGGGGAVEPPASSTTNVPITVIDGAIQNATVCLDKNSNGVRDAGEPFGKTDASGKVTLTVDSADAGKYPVIAVVGTDAIDADTGAVPVPFMMSAPADTVGVVSPLTTLVQQSIVSTGASTADAAASVQAATGINVSLFQDYTKVAAPTDGSVNSALVARMVVVTTQQQSAAIASTVGTTAADNKIITQADLNKAVQNKLMEMLPALVSAMNDPAVQTAATPALKEAALLAAAQALVTSSGLTPAAMATVVAVNNEASSTASVPASTPVAGVKLDSLDFTNTLNSNFRVFTASLVQNTPDASNNGKYVDRRYRSVAGTLATWGAGRDPWRGADLHWNGSAWANCPINFENTSSVRDAQGNSAYNYCDKYEAGKSSQATLDVGGKTMTAVYDQIRAARYTNLTIADPTTALGTATFPTGASVIYQSNTPPSNAIAYYPGSDNRVRQYSATLSAGGIASNQAAGVACNNSPESNTSGTLSTTLEAMMAVQTGTPCVYGQRTFVYAGTTYTSEPVDEGWYQSSLSLGTVGPAGSATLNPVGTGATAPGYYSGNSVIRVAFKGTGTNPVTYYSCRQRFNNGSPRNCTVIGTGSYTISSLGDGRALTLNNPPLLASALTYNRVFVEREGAVYYGYQNKPMVTNKARLNTTATNALLTQLGLPAVDPEVPLALTATSYQGTWDVSDPTQSGGGTTIFVRADGSTSCQDSATLVGFACSLTITPSTGAVSYSEPGTGAAAGTTVATGAGTFSFLTGTGSGTYQDLISATSGNFIARRR